MATKLRWEFPQQEEMHEIEISPACFDTYGLLNFPKVRNCVHGYDEQGVLRKVLYCSRDGRFFVRKKDGWRKLEPNTNWLYSKHPDKPRPKAAGGGTNRASMRHFGCFLCHRLVAYAWCEHPSEANHDPNWYKNFEVDHKNCDHGNWCADNLEWVTVEENMRRRNKIEDPLKKLGIAKISWINIPHLNALYSFEECQLEYFFELLPDAIAKDKRELSLENVNDVISSCIDNVIRHTIRCSRCGRKMIEGTEEHNTHNSILCDCCFTDLYGYF